MILFDDNSYIIIYEGVRQAKQLNDEFYKAIRLNSPLGQLLQNIQLIVSSPLSRCLQTSNYVFEDLEFNTPQNRYVHPLCAERCYLSSDVGRYKHELEPKYPNWNFDLLESDKPWWYTDINDTSGGSFDRDQTWQPSASYNEWRPIGQWKRLMRNPKQKNDYPLCYKLIFILHHDYANNYCSAIPSLFWHTLLYSIELFIPALTCHSIYLCPTMPYPLMPYYAMRSHCLALLFL
jgi:hypothetical protein